jgi:hypothetical protein
MKLLTIIGQIIFSACFAIGFILAIIPFIVIMIFVSMFKLEKDTEGSKIIKYEKVCGNCYYFDETFDHDEGHCVNFQQTRYLVSSSSMCFRHEFNKHHKQI